MANKTEHYQLNQYQPEDDFLRTDFNEDNARIDAALAGKCEVVYGSYIGPQGNEWEWSEVELGFHPKAILVVGHDGINPRFLADVPVQFATRDCPAECLEIANSGIRVLGGMKRNGVGRPYHYVAFL